MPIDNTKLKQLYDTLKQGGYKKDYNNFRTKFLGNENYPYRQKVYNLISQNGEDYGSSYGEFMQRMQVAKPTAAASAAPKQPQQIDTLSTIQSARDTIFNPKAAVQPGGKVAQQAVKDEQTQDDAATKPFDVNQANAFVENMRLQNEAAQRQHQNVNGYLEQTAGQFGKNATRLRFKGQSNLGLPLAPKNQNGAYIDALGREYENETEARLAQTGAQHAREALTEANMQHNDPKNYLLEQKARIEKELNARSSQLERATDRIPSFATGVAGNAMTQAAARLTDKLQDTKYKALTMQLDKVNQALDTLDEAEHAKASDQWIADSGNWIERAGKGVLSFGSATGRSFKRQASKLSNWDFGFSDLAGGLAIFDAVDKADKGGVEALSPEQRKMLDLYAYNNHIQGENKEHLGWGNTAGTVTAQALPFMLEMALNPASGVGKFAQRKAMQWAVKKYGKEKLKQIAKRYLLAKAGTRIAGDWLGAATMSATTGQARVAADAVQRRIGEVETDIDNFGRVTYGGHKNGVDWGEAFGKAFLSNTIENQTEMAGDYFGIIGKAFSKGGQKALDKIGLGFVNDFMRNVSSTKVAKAVTDFENATHWNGTTGEYLEEVLGNVENALMVGDSTFDTDKDTGVFNVDKNIETFLSVAVMGGFFSAVKTASYTAPKKRALNEMADIGRQIDGMLGNNNAALEQWGTWRNTFINGTDEEKKQTLREVMDNQQLPMGFRMAFLEYTKAAQKYHGIAQAEQKRVEEGTLDPIGQALDQAYEEGYGTTEPTERQKAYHRLNETRAQVAQLLELEEDEDLDEAMGNDPIGYIHTLEEQGFTPEQIQPVLDYANAQATYEGMMQQREDRANEQADAVKREVRQITHRQNGQIQKATLDGEREVYILNGKVVLYPDGTGVDKQESDDVLYVQDVQTGELFTIAPNRISELAEPTDPQAVIAEREEEIAAAMNQEIAQEEGAASGTAAPTEAPEVRIPASRFSGARVTLDLPNGSSVNGVVLQETDDGVEVQTDSPVNGRFVQVFPTDEFDGMLSSVRDEADDVIWSREVAEGENAANGQQREMQGNGIPVDAKTGEPVYEAVAPDVAWDAIVQEAEGDEAMAMQVVTDMVADMEAKVQKAKKAKVRAGSTVRERLEAQKKHKRRIEEAEAQLEAWRRIAAVKAERIAAAERAKIEAAQQREVTQDDETEVPDFVFDKPENARERGYRMQNGQRADRQEPIAAAVGKEVSVKFTNKVSQPVRVAVVDARSLQPSHQNGQPNVLHFLPEAQPKKRTDHESVHAAEQMAAQMNPEEITSSVTAYTGAPSVNARGEVIQGNNRTAALKRMWQGYPEQAAAYKQYLMDHASEYGLNPEDIAAMEQPVLVNLMDVTDEQAIELGQYDVKDTESGGTERIKPRNVSQKMGDKAERFASILLRTTDEDASVSQLIDEHAVETLKWLEAQHYISPTQYRSAFNADGQVTPEAKNDLRGILYQAVFKNGSERLEDMFNALPAKAQRAILATAYRDFSTPESEKMLPEIQNSIVAFYELSQDAAFANAKNFEEARKATMAWLQQMQFDFSTGQSVSREGKYTNFALTLAAMYKVQTQTAIQQTFNDMFDLLQGRQQPDLYNPNPNNTPRTLAEAIREVLNIEYDGTNGSHALGGNNETRTTGRQGSARDDSAGEQPENQNESNDHPRRTERNRGQLRNDNKRSNDLPQITEISSAERTEMENRIVDWLSEENLSMAMGKTRDEIFEIFGNEVLPIAYIPTKFINLIGSNIKDQRIYCGKGYFIDHALRNHAKSGMQISAADVDVSKYLNIQAVLDNPDSIKETFVDGKRTVVFIKRIGRYFAELTQIEEGGKIVLHKSFFNQKKEPYAKLNDIRENETSSEGGISSISHAENQSAPAISLQSRGDVVSISNTTGKDTPQNSAVQTSGQENAETSLQSEVTRAEQQTNAEPTEGQKEAGNYKKGRVKVGPFDVVIEQPRGSVRSGVDANGKAWETTMQNTYGYFGGTKGVDGDAIDVFLAHNLDEWDGTTVFVVDQYNPDGSFDEHKVMLGFNSQEEAEAAYFANYESDWAKTHRTEVTAVPLADFNEWVNSSKRKTKAFAEYKVAKRNVEIDAHNAQNEQLAEQLFSMAKEAETEKDFFDRAASLFEVTGYQSDLRDIYNGVKSGEIANARALSFYTNATLKPVKVKAPKSEQKQKAEAPRQSGYERKHWHADSSLEEMLAREKYLQNAMSFGTKEMAEVFPMAEEWQRDREELKAKYGDDLKNALPNDVKNAFLKKHRNTFANQTALNDELYELRSAIISHKEKAASRAEAAAKEQKAEEANKRFGDFLNGKTPLRRASIVKALTRVSNFGKEGSMTMAQFIEKHVAEGTLELRTKEVDKLQGPSRRQLNRMDASQQAQAENRVKQAGKKTEYLINGFVANKTAYEYAEHLLATKNGKAGEKPRKHAAQPGAPAVSTQEATLRDALVDVAQQSGLEVVVDEKAQQVLDEVNERARLSAKQKRALETASIPQKKELQQTVISSADGAKILKKLDKLAEEYDNISYTKEKTFVGNLAQALGASTKGSSSQYATFETINGQIVTIRLANHNASTKRMDDAGRDNAISIVISPKPNEGILNDGDAHIVEFYYNSIKLRKAEGHPLAEIVRSIKQALYSGEYKDTTGLADVIEVNNPRYFRTPSGEAYGFTVDGKIYLDPRIATAETPIHEYAHLWADMIRNVNAEAWNDIVGLMKATPIWEEVRGLYPELKTDDEIADEVLAHYSGRRGAERLREAQQQAAAETGKSVFERAAAVAAIERVKQALAKFWQSVAELFHIRFTSAEEVADRVLADMLNGVNPNQYIKRKGKGVQKLHLNDKTLAGIHNITEEKLRKALNLGGLANPSLAIIDTAQNKHEDFGEISLIAPSALVDKETGQTAGTWTTDAYTQRYPQVERVMSDVGFKKFNKWVESLDLLDSEKSEIKRQTKEAFESNRELSWELIYLLEKGIDAHAYTSNAPYEWKQTLDAYSSADELLDGMQKDEELHKKVVNYVKAELSKPIKGKIREQLREQIKEETGTAPAILPPRYRKQVTEIFNRDYAKDLFGEDLMPGEEDVKKVMQHLFDLHNRTKHVDFSLSKSKASTYVHSHDLYSDYLRWQNKKLKEFGVKGRLFRGYSADGSRKYIPETLKNVSKAMVSDAKGQTNGGEMVSLGSFVAKFADRVDSADEMRANKKRLATNESKQGFYSEWMPTYKELADELSDDIFAGEQRLHDIAVQDNPVKYAKKEYGITLSKSFMDKLNAFKKAIREDMTSAYFETKFERPVYLNEFAAAVIPSDLSEDVKGGLEKSGIAIYEYDPKIEGDRDRATNAAFEADNRIRFQFVGQQGAAALDKAEEATTRLDNLGVAREMERQEKDAKAIKLATGWERGGDGKWRYEIMDGELKAVNERFNEQLGILTEKNADSMVFSLGRPSVVLQSAGVMNKPMKLYGNKVMKKMRKHGFALEELRDLPRAVADPIAVFNNYGEDGNRSILTELRTQQGNFLVTLSTGVDQDVDFNIVRSVFGKGDENVLDWINKGLATYINKEKALSFLSYQSAPIAATAANAGQSSKGLSSASQPVQQEIDKLDTATKVVKDFVNPQLSEENNFREGKGELSDDMLSYLNDPMAQMMGKPRGTKKQRAQFAERERGRMQAHAEKLVERLHLTNVEIVTDASQLEGKQRTAKGFYNKRTGKITIVLPNHGSTADVEQTLLHEAVAHYGLRQLFGEHFDDFLDMVYRNAEEGIRRKIAEASAKHGWNVRTATEEYLADLAERTDFEHASPQWWAKIKGFFLDMLRGLGFEAMDGQTLTDNELRYVLWRSYENLTEPGKYPTFIAEARDVAKQHALQVGRFAPTETAGSRVAENEALSEEETAEILFRDGNDYQYTQALARDRYERRIKSGMYQTQEALQDSMLGLRTAMESILEAEGRKGVYIEDIDGFENAYLGENRLSSVNQAEAEKFAREVFAPMLEEVSKLAPTADERAKLIDYLFAKHGLERNEVMARRAAAKEARKEFEKELRTAARAVAKDPLDQDAEDALDDVKQRMQEREDALYSENRQKTDYAGLTTLTGKEAVADAERMARDMVAAYENAHDTNALWDAINTVTQGTLKKSFDTGMISRDTYDDIRSMYQFYIPLRGFDERTSNEEYSYLGGTESVFTSPIKTAKGRRSKADDPFAYMQMMAESAIAQGNRNQLVKQKLLNFALNHPSDLISVSELWLRRDPVTDQWSVVQPGDLPGTDKLEDSDTAEMVSQKMEQFEQVMQQLMVQNPDDFVRQKDRPDIPYRVVNAREMQQHQVMVKRNGKTYVLTINGNPRAAQAVNGLTNPNNDMSGAIGVMARSVESANRWLSSVYTTRNPDFVLSNLARDAGYTNTMVWLKEDSSYAVNFNRNYATRANLVNMIRLYSRLMKGQLDLTDPTEMLFSQFISNGGETGYTAMRDLDAHKTKIKKELKKLSSDPSVRKVWNASFDMLDLFNKAAENSARFAAFITSREAGRTLDRSIYDAKEISVNFNKKGAGAKFLDSYGAQVKNDIRDLSWKNPNLLKLTKDVAIYLTVFSSGVGRSFFAFWNAAIQGSTNFGRVVKRHPKKALTAMAIMFALGLANAMVGASGDDDDDAEEGDGYFDHPANTRRSNLMLRINGKSWASIPLPVEYRAVYGMGELLGSVMSGKERYTNQELVHEVLCQVSQVLPLDVVGEGSGAFVPTFAKPAFEVLTNESWTGLPIYKQTAYNERDPAYTKAYSNTNKQLVGMSKMLNELSGGDSQKSGWLDVVNPAVVEHLGRGYLGGYFNLVDKLVKTGETVVGSREYDPSNLLIVNRFVKSGSERTAYRAINNRYYQIKADSEELIKDYKGYNYETETGKRDYSQKIAQMKDSPELLSAMKAHEYIIEVDKYNKALKSEQDEVLKKRMEKELYELKSAMIHTVDSILDQKQTLRKAE